MHDNPEDKIYALTPFDSGSFCKLLEEHAHGIHEWVENDLAPAKTLKIRVEKPSAPLKSLNTGL